MAEKEDRGEVIRVSCPAQHLTSLEEMDIDEKSQGSKRKRDTSGDLDFVVSDGQADNKEQQLPHCAAP